MRRAERLFEIVQILRRTRGPISAARIAEEVETSVRTVYRDIAALMAQRVPITGEAGIGYLLDRGFDMPPLMLTADELEAAVLGALWVSTRGEPQLAKSAQDLIGKIEASVPERLRPYVLEPSTSVAPAPGAGAADCSSELRRAIRSGHKVALTYRDSKGQGSERIVWPVVLGYRDAGRILAAWCESRKAFRYFRTDRIESAAVLPQRFPERPARLRTRWRAAMDVERETYGQSAPPAAGRLGESRN